jgi:hypothetical protein
LKVAGESAGIILFQQQAQLRLRPCCVQGAQLLADLFPLIGYRTAYCFFSAA